MKAKQIRCIAALPIALAALWAAPVAACVFTAPIEVKLTYDPPAGMSDPVEIAQWKAEREAFAEAYGGVRREQRVRKRRSELADLAAQTEGMAPRDLAEDLAINLTPPLKPAFANTDSCGGISGPLVLDPAGYHSIAGFEAMAVERGLFEDPADARFIPRRVVRELARSRGKGGLGGCLVEARSKVADALLLRFSRRDLVRALATLRENGFDRVLDDGKHHSYRRTGDFRLLAFVDGRSGALEFNSRAGTNETFWGDTARQELAAEERRRVKAFFSEDELGRALIEEVQSIVANGTEACPQSMQAEQRFWMQVRELALANKARRLERRAQRTGPTS